MNNRSKLTIVIVGIALILVIGIYMIARFPSGSADGNSSSTLTLGVATWIGYGSLYIAQDKDFFKGADITLRRIDDTAIYNSAMLRKEIDGFCNTLDSFAVAAGSGVEGRVVYCFDESAGADGLVAKPSITSFSDLKGRRIAAQTGWPGHFFLLYLMKQAGLGPADYVHVNLDSDKAGAAFMSGDLDAAVVWEPWLSKICTAGQGHLLTSSKEHPGIIVDALIMRPGVLSEKDKAVGILVNGCLQAVEYWRSHPEEGNEIVARHFSLSAEEVGEMVQGVKYLDRKANQEYLKPDGMAVRTLRMASDIWVEAGAIDKGPNLVNVVTDDYVR